MRNTYLALWALSCFFLSCRAPDRSQQKSDLDSIQQFVEPVKLDLAIIRARGYLTAIVDNSATSMFLYRGEPMGYEYELISQFADTLGLELRFKIARSIEEGFELLNNGEGDILAHNLTITKKRKEIIEFTNSHYTVRQMLVQRKPVNWRDMKLHEIEKTLIRNPIELIGKEIHVRKASSYASRLENLSNEVGGEILVFEEDNTETERLIEMVVDSVINYTIADENIARMMARFHPIIDAETAVSFPQQIAWGLRSNADSLKLAVNSWLADVKGTSVYNELFSKYFRNSIQTRKIFASEYYSNSGHRISPYDSLLQKAGKELGWDWKLLAAQVSKESRYDPDAKSWMGAVGLMQVMPKTASAYGIKNLRNPEQNIDAGIRHLQWLKERWSVISDSTEKVKFMLGSYNVGYGHVKDAARLTEKHGGDPTQWKYVANYLKLKSQKKYYEDSVVQFGYCRGEEPIQYVDDILFRYNRYVQMAAARAPQF